jgi:putative flippase GtrA
MEETTVTPGPAGRLIARLPRPAVVSKFALTGALVGATHLGLVSLMVVFGIPIQLALALGYVVALVVHFTMNRQWVFAADAGYALHVSAQGMRYLVCAGLSYAVTAIAVAVLPGLLGLPELAVFFLSAIGMAGITFVMLNFWVFRSAQDRTA